MERKILRKGLFVSIIVFIFLNNIYGIDDLSNIKFIHYTNEDGLPSSYVKGITQDQYGFVWLATRVSVCRFDGQGFKDFPVFDEDGREIELKPQSINSYNDSILIASTVDGKYFIYDFNLECFKPFKIINEQNNLQVIEYSSDGKFWICRDSTIFSLDMYNSSLREFTELYPLKNNSEIKASFIKERNGLIASITNKNQLLSFDKKRALLDIIDLSEVLKDKFITLFYLDSYNHAWIGIETKGLYRINLINGKINHYSQNKQGKNFILHNLVHCMTEDHLGRLWIGTEDGLCIWSPKNERFKYFQYSLTNPEGLNTNPIYSAFCDREGNIWLGTYFGGINFWKSEKGYFERWRSGAGKTNLGGNVVSCFEEDDNGNLWIGLEDMGLNKLDISTGQIEKIRQSPERNSLSYNNVHDLLFETSNKLWIATYSGGINIYNTETGEFKYINQKNHSELPSDFIYVFLKSNDSIYIGTKNGVAIYNIQTKELSPFYENLFNGIVIESMCETEDRIWFSARNGVYYYHKKTKTLHRFEKIPHFKGINFVKKDSKGRVWIGDSYEGICFYDEQTDKIEYFNENIDFPVSWIFSIEECKDNIYWASSGKGLVRFNAITKKHDLFDSNSGIPFNQFNYRASFKDSKGTIYFGGNNGMVSFAEEIDNSHRTNLNVIFTGLQLFNQTIRPGENSVLNKSLCKTDELTLKYKENVLTIEFSALRFANQGTCQYAYYLENFENSWNYVGNKRFATYTNLSPGEYVFHVMASENVSDWSNNETLLNIVIKPPWYLSSVAFILYLIIIGFIFLVIIKISSRIQKSKALVEIERKEREQIENLNQMKFEFFTNISHELRTPLTMIVGPVSSILDSKEIPPGIKNKLLGVERNIHRLLTLINELLEFRKIEGGKEKLSVAQIDLGLFSADIYSTFNSVAEAKNIDFSINGIDKIDELIWFDQLKIEKIIFNLLSNAFKYSSENDKIILDFKLEKPLDDKKNNDYLNILVEDTGKGIPSSVVSRIFDRFFQADNNNYDEKGSGIGLAFVKSLVNLHKGAIRVTSNYGKGTTFEVRIPVSKFVYAEDEIHQDNKQFNQSNKKFIDLEPELKPVVKQIYNEKPSILVIDDNKELINFICENFEDKFNVSFAYDGSEGLEKLKESTPELIISDIMMSEMDGINFTHQVKTDINTSHIPILLLTAKSGIDSKYEGLQSGADLYIEKPFIPAILEQNIINILNTRKHLVEKYKSDVSMPPTEITHSESDFKFIESLTEIIKSNLDKTSLDVSFIIKEMGISRSLLHLKLKKIADCSTTEFIRSVRIREAVKLINDGKCNISEAAYQAGFSSPAYFTRRFKELYGKSPSKYFFK